MARLEFDSRAKNEMPVLDSAHRCDFCRQPMRWREGQSRYCDGWCERADNNWWRSISSEGHSNHPAYLRSGRQWLTQGAEGI